MPTPIAPAPLPGDVSPEALLHTLLTISPMGIMLLRPVYAEAGSPAPLVDFAWEQLNPAAQLMLGLPERPTESFLTLFPTAQAAGVFGFYRDAFLSGRVERRENLYQADGLDGYYRLVAQRQEALLVVSFTDANDEPRSVVEQALRESQVREQEAYREVERQRHRLYEVLMQLPAHIAVHHGPAQEYTLVNPAYQRLTAGRDLLGQPVREAWPELTDQGILDTLDRVYQTGEPFVGTEIPLHVDFARNEQPTLSYHNVYYLPLHDAQGRVNGVLDFSYEVTEQVLARQQVQQLNQELEARVQERTREVREQQALLGRILGQMPAALATLSGPAHQFTYFNEQYQYLVGQRAVHGVPVAVAFPEAIEQGFIALLDEVYRSGNTHLGYETPMWLAQPDGKSAQRYLDFIYQPLHDAHHHTQGILVFAIDVTARVLARREVEQAAQRLRLLTDALPVLIGYLDRNHVYRFANEAYRTWFDQDPAALLGRPVREVVGEAAYQVALPRMERALAGEHVNFEASMPYRPGFTRRIRTSYIPDVQAGQVVGFYTLVTDVTQETEARERAQDLNDELQLTNAQLTRTNFDLDTFVYTASHDLKGPITNIEGLLTALREELGEGMQADPLVQSLLGMMEKSVTRFQDTLYHLTDITRLQNEQHLPQEAINLPALVEDVRLDLLPELTAAGVTVEIQLADCPTVKFAPKSLRSIVYNLLSNAIKYRAPDRAPLVQLRCHHTAQGWVLLEVQDNGLGLSEQQQQQGLFQLFRRMHTHVKGTGVGLYMVKRLIENAGGTITVQSQEGVGSTFIVSLPTG